MRMSLAGGNPARPFFLYMKKIEITLYRMYNTDSIIFCPEQVSFLLIDCLII